MRQGFPDYGAFISSSKTLLNFEHDFGTDISPMCSFRNGAPSFPYCGFLIDTHTLEMSADHPRLLQIPVRQSFAVRSSRRLGSGFVGWLCRQLENRNHVGYLDTAHNALEVVHLNIYINFATTAMKIPHYFGSKPLSKERSRMVFGGSLRQSRSVWAEEQTHYALLQSTPTWPDERESSTRQGMTRRSITGSQRGISYCDFYRFAGCVSDLAVWPRAAC